MNNKNIKKVLSVFSMTLTLGIISGGCISMNQEYNDISHDIGQNLGGNEESISFAGKNYIPVFYDDFNGKELDEDRWERCPEWPRQDAGGYWSNNCSFLEEGNLVIEAKKDENGKLVSGAVRSKGKFEQNGGLYKIRFKAEKASGLWYAFWLMTDRVSKIGGGAVNGGEIDIIEILPNDPWQEEGKKTYLNSAVHWDGYGDRHKSHGSQYYIDDSFYDQWHEVTFEWTSEYYKAYLDDSSEPFWDSTIEGAETWGGIVKSSNYMKITAEFGKWGGEIAEDALPARMYVDWVKVYKAE